MLKRLADIGMALVEKLAADVEAGAAKGDPAASFEKLAQAVRRTLAIDQTVRLICKEMGMDSDAYVGGPDNPNSVPAAILNSG